MPTAIKVMVDAAPWLLQGAVMTLETSLLAIALGLPVGIALAVAQRARLRMLRGFVSVYISFARGTPSRSREESSVTRLEGLGCCSITVMNCQRRARPA